MGPNGSGKSLLTCGLFAAFGSGLPAQQARELLENAGIDAVRIDFISRNWLGHLSLTILDGQRLLTWDKPQPAERHGAAGSVAGFGKVNNLADCIQPPTDDPCELFPAIHVVASGMLAIPEESSLRSRVVHAVKAPLERELAGWQTRSRELAGDDGQGGRLAEARRELAEAEQSMARLTRLQQDLDQAAARRDELMAEIAQKRLQRDVLSAETEALSKACRLADRAVRIESWCEEIRRDSRDVSRLREQHSEAQARLDLLEERFRGLPDDFPERLEEFNALCSRELMLSAEIATAEREGQYAQSEIEEIQRELSLLPTTSTAEFDSRSRELDAEIDAVNTELTALLRGRIETIRQREGLRQQITRDFAAFDALDREQKELLARWLEQPELPAAPETDPAVEAKLRATEDKIVAVRQKLRDKFVGFDQLPDTARDMIHELAEARHHFTTSSSDLSGLRQRIQQLNRRGNPRRGFWCAMLSAAAAFGGITALDQWDTGLFAALAASGITLLIFWFVHRRVELDLESLTAAESMTQKRVETERESIARLEKVLGSLALAANVSEALARLAEFRSLQDEHEQLQHRVAKYHHELRTRSSAEPEGTRVDPAGLPAALLGLPRETLDRTFRAYLELIPRLDRIESTWQDYEEGGSKAKSIREMEERIAELQHARGELQESFQRFRQKNDERRAELLSRRSTLEGLAADSERIDGMRREHGRLRGQIAGLQQMLGEVNSLNDVETLRHEWTEREGLRGKLREIRSSLSAHQTQDELRAREMLLTEEAAEVKQKLTALDPLYLLQGTASDCAAKYAGQLAATRDSIAECDAAMKACQIELDSIHLDGLQTKLMSEPQFDLLQSAAAAARERMESIERDLMTTRDLMTSIESELLESDPATKAYIDEAVDHRLRQLSGEKYLSLDMNNGTWLVACSDGSSRKMTSMSDGTRDLIWIAVRLALLDVARTCDDSPVIWDEALSRLDDRHLVQVREALCKVATQRQVVLFTRHSSFETWGPIIRLSSETERTEHEALTS
jgi:hypothetical protein